MFGGVVRPSAVFGGVVRPSAVFGGVVGPSEVFGGRGLMPGWTPGADLNEQSGFIFQPC